MCCKLLGVEFDFCWKHCNSHNGNHLSCSNFFVHFLFTAIHRGSFLVQNHGSNHLVFSKTCWTGFFLRWGEEVGPLKIPPHAPHPPTECHPYAAWSTCCWSLTQQMEGISLHPVSRVICVAWKKGPYWKLMSTSQERPGGLNQASYLPPIVTDSTGHTLRPWKDFECALHKTFLLYSSHIRVLLYTFICVHILYIYIFIYIMTSQPTSPPNVTFPHTAPYLRYIYADSSLGVRSQIRKVFTTSPSSELDLLLGGSSQWM